MNTIKQEDIVYSLTVLMCDALKYTSSHGIIASLCSAANSGNAEWEAAMRQGCEALWWRNRGLGEIVRRHIDMLLPEFTQHAESAKWREQAA